jgi:hypothetical protein
MPARFPEPWLSFLRDVDRALSQPVEIGCIGGFVLLVMWEIPRATGDVDFIYIDPEGADEELLNIAGEDTELWKRYKLKFQRVTVADIPEGYAARLSNITPPSFQRLHLRALEVHDLVLTKLGRFKPVDRQDIAFLVNAGALDRGVLERRFEEEVRPYVLNEPRATANMKLCLDECFGTGR